jgi:DNA-binding response OmpR family regulator
LLLLDLKLPKKSGLEVLKWIRNETAVSTLPVIVLSSSLQDADIHRAYVQGANAYLVKPSAPGELSRMVTTIRDFWLSHNRTDEASWDTLGVEWNRPKNPL